MMSFLFTRGEIPGLVIIEPKVYSDERGVFMESYKRTAFFEAGIREDFVQDNVSVSEAGVIRGLHFQRPPYAQAKLVRVTRGRVWDVIVDLREDSPTEGRWFAVELSRENGKMLYIPAGFAHGFLAHEDGTEFLYKCSVEYNASSESGIRWDDPDLDIPWPERNPRVSPRDRALPSYRDHVLRNEQFSR